MNNGGEKNAVLLLSTLHDPEARLLPYVRALSDAESPLGSAWRDVRGNYRDVLCFSSPATDPRSNVALAAAGWEVVVRPEDGEDRGMFRAVQAGLDRGAELIHYCDLDRFVHWLGHYPDELRALPRVWGRNDLTMLVRGPRAFASHPPAQALTEAIGNRAISARLGVDADALSGSYLWSRRAAEAVAAFPGPRDLRFYAVGVLAPFNAGCGVGRHVVEGLEWETPDQYPAEIAALGRDAWLARFQTPEQWRHRVEMAKLWVEEALIGP